MGMAAGWQKKIENYFQTTLSQNVFHHHLVGMFDILDISRMF